MTAITPARQPKGVPVGGEFATTAHADTGLELGRPFASHSPLQVDTLLAELYSQAAKVDQRIERSVASAHYRLGHRKGHRRGLPNDGWPTDAATALTDLEAAIATETIPAWESKGAKKILTDVEDLQAQQADIAGRTAELGAEYSSRPWSRFFLVTSSNGHIHSSMSCHTCRYDTAYGWLPDLSGKTEPDAVADQGAILCTACYQSAPVEWTRGKDADPLTCPGSNQAPAGDTRMFGRTRYGTCPVCGDELPAGYSGIRKHKTKK